MAAKAEGVTQLALFRLPWIKHGKEWITGCDSKGWWMFWTRPVGSSGPFYNHCAGERDDLRSTCEKGEFIDEFGNIVLKNVSLRYHGDGWYIHFRQEQIGPFKDIDNAELRLHKLFNRFKKDQEKE